MTRQTPESNGHSQIELILRDALLGDGRRVDISIANGTIVALDPPGQATAGSALEHRLDGDLVVAGFGEPHAHLDKALTADRIPNPDGDLMGAVMAWNRAMSEGWFDYDNIVERSSEALERLLARGVTAVRTHVNVNSRLGPTGVRALRSVARTYTDQVDLEVVALVSHPLTGPEGAPNRAALDEAMEAGADLVGGAPQFDDDPDAHLDHTLAVAVTAGCGMDLHIDESLNPQARSLKYLARRVQETGFEHTVTASHCVSLSVQSELERAATSREVAAAGIAVVTLPQTNLFLQARDHVGTKPRGLTSVTELQDAGVVIGAGADNVEDPFNLLGRSDPLETAALMVLAGHQSPLTALAMISANVRQIMGLRPVSFVVGDPADLVVLQAGSVREAIARAPGNRSVYRRGRLTAECSMKASVRGNELRGL
ncbi:MAG: amidohydrolase family protein [Acidimicrobiales bacterium]